MGLASSPALHQGLLNTTWNLTLSSYNHQAKALPEGQQPLPAPGEAVGGPCLRFFPYPVPPPTCLFKPLPGLEGVSYLQEVVRRRWCSPGRQLSSAPPQVPSGGSTT